VVDSYIQFFQVHDILDVWYLSELVVGEIAANTSEYYRIGHETLIECPNCDHLLLVRGANMVLRELISLNALSATSMMRLSDSDLKCYHR
jgi:hypothetical protein